MKTTPTPRPRLDNLIISLLILASHFSPFLCRPQSHGHHKTPSWSHGHHPSHITGTGSDRTHSIHDLNITDAMMAKFGGHKNNAPSSTIDSRAISLNRFDHDTRPIDGDSNDSHLSRVGDGQPLANNDSRTGLPQWTIHGDVDDEWTTQGDVYYESEGFVVQEGVGKRNSEVYDDVGDDTLAAHADMNEVSVPSPSGRIWKRRRHQRSSPNDPDRRRGGRRRQHRLLLKTRDRDNKDRPHQRRRDRFLLKPDGPGQVIFRAGEVKKDWCRTIPFEQNVTSGRCSKTVKNNLCYGQCNSFFIPQSEKGSSKVAFQSLSSCKPHRLRWVNVTLDCPHGRNQQRVVQKTILKVESCRCIAADSKEMNRQAEYLRKSAKNIRVNQ